MLRFTVVAFILLCPIFLFSQDQDFDVVDSMVKTGQADKALSILRSSAVKQKAVADWQNYFDTKRKEAKVLSKVQRWSEVINLADSEIPLCKSKLGNTSAHISKFLREKASAQNQTVSMEIALETLREAEQVARNSMDKEELLTVLQHSGGLLYQAADYHAALPHFRESVPLGYAVMADDSMKIGRFHYLLGSSYWGVEQRDSCKFHYNRALEFWIPTAGQSYRHIGDIYNVLGEYAWKEGDEKLALEYFNKYAKIQLKNNPNPTDNADNLIAKAQNLSGNENLDQMLVHYKEALEYRSQTLGVSNPAAVGCYNYIALVLAEMQNPGEALKTCQQAIELYCPGFKSESEFDNPKSLEKATSYQLLLDVLLLKYDLLTTKHSEKSKRVTQSTEEVIGLCIQLFDELRTGQRREETKLFWSEKLYPFFENVLGFYNLNFNPQLSTTQQNRMLELMEKSKAFVLSEALKNTEAFSVSGVPEPLQQQERDLQNKMNDVLRFLQLEEKRCEEADAAKLVTWRNQLQSLRLEHDLLVARFEKDFPDYYRLKYDNSVVSIDEIRERLNDDQTFLEYFFGSSEVYFVRITKSEFEFGTVASSEELNYSIQQLRKQLSDISYALQYPDSAFQKYTQLAYSIFTKLFPHSISKSLPAQLLIVPDGPIAQVPFDVLLKILPSANGRNYSQLDYLLKHASTSYAANATTWISSLDKKRNSQREYFGFAPAYSPSGQQQQFVSRDGIQPLKFNDDEILAAQKLLGGKTFLNQLALESTLKNQSSEAGILHLAMHTLINDSLPMFSGFLFEQEEDSLNDGVLSAQEIYTLNLHAQLALLSACNTGTGNFQRGEGMMSLARAFNYAGCPSLVYSLWECDDENTQKIVVAFLENLKNGMTKDEALRKAKLSYLENADAQFSHPYYWASLVSQGNQEPVNFSNRKPWIFGGAVVLIGAVVGRMIRRRRKALPGITA